MIPATTGVADGKENFLLQIDSKKPIHFHRDGHFTLPVNANSKKSMATGRKRKIRVFDDLNKKASFLSDFEEEAISPARQSTGK